MPRLPTPTHPPDCLCTDTLITYGANTPPGRHRANRPTDAPSQNTNSTRTGANRYARAYAKHRTDRP
jgi:hypothetical protein